MKKVLKWPTLTPGSSLCTASQYSRTLSNFDILRPADQTEAALPMKDSVSGLSSRLRVNSPGVKRFGEHGAAHAQRQPAARREPISGGTAFLSFFPALHVALRTRLLRNCN